ncbi:MAG: hypothetical protein H0T79_14030 [Deltaproteobacteria bacterium]|nr:hypothetical protein [Deltaproteobacteria bacterium]
MRLKLLPATLLLAGTIGSADARPITSPAGTGPDDAITPLTPLIALADRDVLEARTTEREAAARVRHYAAVTMIAERDLQTARVERDVSLANQQTAIVAGDEPTADAWFLRHSKALLDERAALGRVLLYRAERDIARTDLKRATKSLEYAMAKLERAQRAVARLQA